jgi:formylglycine-generating enzyme required for sulfatase activity
MTTPRYSLRNIRKLVTDVYTVEELRRLCYEEFRPVYDNYADVPKLELVRHLIEHCERKGLFEQLLALIEADAPGKYAEYKDQLWYVESDGSLDPEAEGQPLPRPSVALTLTALSPQLRLGDEANWLVALHNDGNVDLLNVVVRRGRTLLDDPFDLAVGQSRQFMFVSTPRTKGRKSKKVSVIGSTVTGQDVLAEASAAVLVQAALAQRVVVEPNPNLALEAGSAVLQLELPVDLALLRIPAGEFLMGSDRSRDETAPDNEQPQHRVYLSDFYLGQYPVTNGQFAAFVKATGYAAHAKWDVRGIWFLSSVQFPLGSKKHPAVYVSWVDAVAFCDWLSQESGYRVRLPTEAEWEKAARGREGRIYPWGNDWDYRRLNSTYGEADQTTPVGSYSPQGDSPYGLADMAGNVWEWCADWFDETLYQGRAGTVVRNPTGPAQGSRRVLRGGSWSGDRFVARCAYRNRFDPGGRHNTYGFRVAIGE